MTSPKDVEDQLKKHFISLMRCHGLFLVSLKLLYIRMLHSGGVNNGVIVEVWSVTGHFRRIRVGGFDGSVLPNVVEAAEQGDGHGGKGRPERAFYSEALIYYVLVFDLIMVLNSSKAIPNMLRDQADHASSYLQKLDVMIFKMRQVRTVAGNNSLDCLKESHQIERNKLKALADLIVQTDDAIRRKEGHVDIIDLSE
ncbi:hypothetical protein Tco_0749396 [Tanacetum coccineum]|uniref:Uncharacterized protein n=1 Tax=Tanacetum coccineum TaxID=301880 RepID=A0ABQ4Z157_9ASTR